MEITLFDEDAIIVVEDQSVRNTGLEPGDLYAACRNTGWQLLTCLSVRPDDDTSSGWVVPVENDAYSYDLHECYKVIDLR